MRAGLDGIATPEFDFYQSLGRTFTQISKVRNGHIPRSRGG
jgi:hypothetical protein